MIPVVVSQPLISTSSAHYISLALGTIYVGSLYLSKNARLSLSSNRKGRGTGENLRDDPDVIWARMAAVSVATAACCTIVAAVISQIDPSANTFTLINDILLRLGAPFPTKYSVNIYAHLVAPMLFLGPLYVTYLNHELPGQRNWSWEYHVAGRFGSVQGLRNYVVGPITEEIVFRACVLSVYHMSGASNLRMIFFGPLVFGLAHVHHAYDAYLTKGRNWQAFKSAVSGSLFQFAYTTLFGFYVSFLFLRTGSVLAPILAHVFCNVMGLPQIQYELRRHPRHANSIKWMYWIGIIGFIITLRIWTKTDDSFYWQDQDVIHIY